jgi:DNA processing protein
MSNPNENEFRKKDTDRIITLHDVFNLHSKESVKKPFEGATSYAYKLEDLLGPLNDVEKKYAPKELYIAGILPVPLPRPRLSVIGSRNASLEGLNATSTIVKILVKNDAIVVSGLARGIDTMAHRTAIKKGGCTIAVLGTPLNKVYPKENASLQDFIMHNHLAISQFPLGYPTKPINFVIRNRTMALISHASIIVEAGDSSGSLHQGWEALRLGRPLFIWKSIIKKTDLKWPQKMIKYGAIELYNPEEIFDYVPNDNIVLNLAM